MTKEYCFRIADFLLSVRMPDNMNVDRLLPSFRAFRSESPQEGERLFDCDVLPVGDALPVILSEELLETAENEMGLIRLYGRSEEYVLTLASHSGDVCHILQTDKAFTRLKAFIRMNRTEAGHALSSLLRIAYSQAILYHHAVSVHSAAVHDGTYAYLFMGKSGTGKSTHAALWREYIPGCGLLNDDNPTLRLAGNEVRAYGTPWSGKTPCYKQLSFPVAGIVRLQQAPHNKFHQENDTDAFIALYPGCSFLHKDPILHNRLCETLIRVVQSVRVGVLECRPDSEAVHLCHQELIKHT